MNYGHCFPISMLHNSSFGFVDGEAFPEWEPFGFHHSVRENPTTHQLDPLDGLPALVWRCDRGRIICQ